MQHLVIVGGGFAGLWAALVAAREAIHHGRELNVTLVSRDSFLTLRPRLYERDPESLRTALLPVLQPVGVNLMVGTVVQIDSHAKSLEIATPEGARLLRYDRLILATGSRLKTPDIPGLAEHGWSIDDYEAAIDFDAHLRDVTRTSEAPGHNCFVVLGAGFTGIELATELRSRIEAHGGSETAAGARVVMIDRNDAVGATLGANPRPVIEAALQDARIETRLGATVRAVDEQAVHLGSGERIETRSVISTAGLQASPLAGLLPVERDEVGRLPTDAMLRVEGMNGVYAAGDIARAYVDGQNLALMSCQHALFMGRAAGFNASHDLLGLPLRPYRQPQYVTCLDLGASGAVFTRGWEREVAMTGDEAKKLKRYINCERIYPPQGDRAAILAAADIDAREDIKSAKAS